MTLISDITKEITIKKMQIKSFKDSFNKESDIIKQDNYKAIINKHEGYIEALERTIQLIKQYLGE